MHAWARERWVIDGCTFCLFRWTKDFDLKKEPSIVAQWIFLPGLPMHMYRVDCLQILAMRFSRFLGTDNLTLNKTKASGARICVEIDLLEEPIQNFLIGVSTHQKIWQEARYEKQGSYCRKCHRQGHTEVICRVGLKEFKLEKRVSQKADKKGKKTEVWKVRDSGANKKKDVSNDLVIGEKEDLDMNQNIIVEELEDVQHEGPEGCAQEMQVRNKLVVGESNIVIVSEDVNRVDTGKKVVDMETVVSKEEKDVLYEDGPLSHNVVAEETGD